MSTRSFRARLPRAYRGLSVIAACVVSVATAAPTDLLISEYVEGSGNNKALELYNGTGASIDLAAAGYVVQMYFNGSSSPGVTVPLGGSVAAGDVHVLAHSSAVAAVLAQADQTIGGGWFNGDDAIVLRKGGAGGPIVDSIGQVGFDPGSEWGSGLISTADNTLRRMQGVEAGDTNPGDVFDPSIQWDGYPVDSFDGLGTHGTAGGGDEGGGEPQSGCGQPFTPIPAIQGSGMAAAVTGPLSTQGVVVGDYEGSSPSLRGFYIQDPAGDGDPQTSDGLFVFNGNFDRVQLGELVRVTGTAGEFQGQTQISSVTSIEVCGTGSVTPTDVTLPFASADAPERFEGMLVRLPQTLFVTEHFQLGRFGQIVMSSGARLVQPTHIAEPGAAALAQQAANALNRLIVDDELNNQNPDPIRFGRSGNPLTASNTLRGGDSATGIVGVLTYTWAGNSASGNAYRVRPFGALGGGVPDFVAANPRPESAPSVGGSLRVASFNLLNYFNTFTGCSFGVGGAAADCRGADNVTEFDRQVAKTVAALVGMDADVIGVMELENDGYGADSAIRHLVDALNAQTAPDTYAFVDADAATGAVNALGTDAIKVGLIYRPAAVTAEGTAVLNTGAFGDYSTVSEGTIGRNRPALAQTFRQNSGGRFTVVVNHLKSKGSSCDGNIAPVGSDPDLGDGQGNCNLTRTTAARELAAWLAGDPTGSGHSAVLLIGDLNAYAKEDPVRALEEAGYVNLIGGFGGDDAYSYVFDGQWGYLDHALASETMLPQVSGATEWHINADEPGVLDYNTNFKSAAQIASLYAPDALRSSDHDPVIVGLDLDGEAPSLELAATPSVLWPPNHRYVTVKVTPTVADNLDPAPLVELLSAVSNEPDNGEDDGNTVDDVVVLDDFSFKLRAERSGKGSGRTYTLTYRTTDFAGNSRVESATVVVPLRAPR
jgi:uncharacterized protein